MKELYFAGGCFWGVEEYFSRLNGVKDTSVGYANGFTKAPSYEDVCRRNTGHAETVKVVFDETVLSLKELLQLFYRIIDPTAVNRQGPDVGIQYRTGIYYVDKADETLILDSLEELQKKYPKKLAVESKQLEHFYPAEEYHQNYLKKNPYGYCHISKDAFQTAFESNHLSNNLEK